MSLQTALAGPLTFSQLLWLETAALPSTEHITVPSSWQTLRSPQSRRRSRKFMSHFYLVHFQKDAQGCAVLLSYNLRNFSSPQVFCSHTLAGTSYI